MHSKCIKGSVIKGSKVSLRLIKDQVDIIIISKSFAKGMYQGQDSHKVVIARDYEGVTRGKQNFC